MMICDNCHEEADEMVVPGESRSLAEGPEIKVCHTPGGTYIHVGVKR